MNSGPLPWLVKRHFKGADISQKRNFTVCIKDELRLSVPLVKFHFLAQNCYYGSVSHVISICKKKILFCRNIPFDFDYESSTDVDINEEVTINPHPNPQKKSLPRRTILIIIWVRLLRDLFWIKQKPYCAHKALKCLDVVHDYQHSGMTLSARLLKYIQHSKISFRKYVHYKAYKDFLFSSRPEWIIWIIEMIDFGPFFFFLITS